MVHTGMAVLKKFYEEDSPVVPGGTVIRGLSGDLKAPSTELMAVRKSISDLPTWEGIIDNCAACLGLVKVAGGYTTPLAETAAA